MRVLLAVLLVLSSAHAVAENRQGLELAVTCSGSCSGGFARIGLTPHFAVEVGSTDLGDTHENGRSFFSGYSSESSASHAAIVISGTLLDAVSVNVMAGAAKWAETASSQNSLGAFEFSGRSSSSGVSAMYGASVGCALSERITVGARTYEIASVGGTHLDVTDQYGDRIYSVSTADSARRTSHFFVAIAF